MPTFPPRKTLGPVAIIGLSDLPATRLIQPGSLYESKYRLRLPGSADPEAVGKRLTAAFPDAGWDVTNRSNGAPGTRRFIERMGQFLSLVGLAALVIHADSGPVLQAVLARVDQG